tara:strand:- start:686 stop:1285 length:600 start_codon:yes stop_codon:yes gene_type:complete
MSFYVQDFIKLALKQNISSARKVWLNEIIEYIKVKIENNQEINLNFICTHNSRRSQFSQVWAKVASVYYGIEINSYSGGVEVTAFNERAIDSLVRSGFSILFENSTNPKYEISYSENKNPIIAFSKLFDDDYNKADYFAAIMTCSDADENCPHISKSEKRIPLRYDDPKFYDDTPYESEKYDEKSLQIASEMFYVFSKI